MNIRPAQPPDYPGICQVVNAFEQNPVTVETVARWFDLNPPGRISYRRVVVDDQEAVIGYSVAVHESWQEEGLFYVWVGVLPVARRQGAGGALYLDACRFLEGQTVRSLVCDVRDDDPVALEFAERRGFCTERHQFESTLDLEAFDASWYVGIEEGLVAAGIRITSMAELGDSQEARKKHHAVNAATEKDIPGSTGHFLSFEEFEQWVYPAYWYRAEGQLLALDGEEFVGLSAVQLFPEVQGSYNLMTGVLPAYRGRHIALALKLRAIQYARACGARTMSTSNDSLNAPMLAINRKLGYVPKPGKFILKRNYAAGGSVVEFERADERQNSPDSP